MTFPVMLQFCTEDKQWVSLCEKYWEIDNEQHFVHKVSELANEFGIPSKQITKLVSTYSKAFSNNICCTGCQIPYIFLSRSDFQQYSGPEYSWTCKQCQHEANQVKEAQRIRALEQYREIIRAKYKSDNPGPIDPIGLSLESAVYLLSFVRLLATEDLGFARPLSSVKRRLSPTTNWDWEIVRLLYREDLISVDPDSEIEAFNGETAGSFYLDRVQWHLPVGVSSDNPKDFASELEEILRSNEWPPEWVSGRLDLWRKVALQECLQYLAVALSDHGFSFNPGEKTNLVLNNLLEDYSVSQIYNLIWRAAKDAAAFYVREAVSKPHAANTVIGAIQRYGEKAKAERWEVKAYRRNFNCPQSIISEVLFNAVLRIGDDGFNKIPSIKKLVDLEQSEVVFPNDGAPGENIV
jgi:hypothetical protein